MKLSAIRNIPSPALGRDAYARGESFDAAPGAGFCKQLGGRYQSRGVSQNFIRRLFCKASVCTCVAAILSETMDWNPPPQPCCTRLLRTRISNKSGSIVRSFRRRSSEGCCSHDLEFANVDDDGVAEVNDDDMMIISMMLMDDDATADDSLLLACSEFGGRGSHRSHEK